MNEAQLNSHIIVWCVSCLFLSTPIIGQYFMLSFLSHPPCAARWDPKKGFMASAVPRRVMAFSSLSPTNWVSALCFARVYETLPLISAYKSLSLSSNFILISASLAINFLSLRRAQRWLPRRRFTTY
jgi:hypothetical protein